MKKKAIALGFFDGLHIGHQTVIRKARDAAEVMGFEPAVLTFQDSPKRLSDPDIKLINTLEDKKFWIKKLLGIDEVIALPFDNWLKNVSYKDFVKEYLVGQFNAGYVSAGENYRFGRGGTGDAKKLAIECEKLGIACEIVPSFKISGAVISSTEIRKLIAKGDIERAADLLGHSYALMGYVLHGKKLGRDIGIPTINLPFDPNAILPPFGVYFSKFYIGEREYAAITNIGVRPTVGGNIPNCETHIPFVKIEDLYGNLCRVEFLKFLRPERRFEMISELKNQIAQDIEHYKEFFGI